MFSQHEIVLQPLTTENGLSQNTANYIFQDNRGFIWIGTHDGLNKFDGHRVTVYKFREDDSNSIQSNDNYCAFEDINGNVFFGTGYGISVYNRELESFENISFSKDDFYNMRPVWDIIEGDLPNTLWIGASGGLFRYNTKTKEIAHFAINDSISGANSVKKIITGENNHLWLGTNGGGLHCFNPRTGKVVGFLASGTKKGALSDNTIQTMYKDARGVLWIGTDNGVLNRFNPADSSFTHFFVDARQHKTILAILEDKSGVLWVGTDKGGLLQFDRKTEKFKSVTCKTQTRISVFRTLFEDFGGNLWIGTYGTGIFIYDRLDNNFNYYFPFDRIDEKTCSNSVNAIYQDRDDGALWIGTDGGGLVWYSLITGEKKYYKSNGKGSLAGNTVLCIKHASDDKIYIGTFLDGLSVYDKKTGRFTNYKYVAGNPGGLNDNTIWDIFEDDNGTIWLATNNGGINLFNPHTKLFSYLMNDRNLPGSLSSNSVRCILKDSRNFIWVGTVTGLNLFNPVDSSFKGYFYQPGNHYGLSNNSILCIHEDFNNNLWLGTHGGGLNRFDIKTGTFIHYSEIQGLPGNVVYGILEDEQAHLWLSSEKGLSRFHIATGGFRNFDASSGLFNAQFNIGAHFKSAGGELFFGSINGVCHFYPWQIKQNNYAPPVYITSLSLFNKTVGIGGASPLKKSVSESDTIVLNHKQSVINLGFAALNYTHAGRNMYKYMLYPFEENWNDADFRNNATYTNLDPGKYIFKVKGSNNDGIWNETPTELVIVITPPFYKTLWFRLAAIGFVCVVLFVLFRLKVRSVHMHNKKLERLVDMRTREIEIKNKQLIEAEKLNAHLTQQQLENVLMHKSKELSKYTLLIIQKNRLLEELKKRLREAVRNPAVNMRDNFKDIIRSINSKFSPEQEWNEFDANFNRVHGNFAENLKSHFPDLTQNDLRLCALYRLDIPTRDIANIMGISMSSVKMARYRLRKKIGLEPGDDLVQFLLKLQESTDVFEFNDSKPVFEKN
ncbi:MAG: hypothetical protein JXB34_06505 [Bacteroidales bacterium]|nr:hypothetical protein [Bacteroidales bacterium]